MYFLKIFSCRVWVQTCILAKTEFQISSQLSVCAWVFPEWLRWFPVIEVFEAETSAPGWATQRLLSCYLMENKGILDFRVEFIKVQNSEFIEIHTEIFKMNSSFSLQNILRFSRRLKNILYN